MRKDVLRSFQFFLSVSQACFSNVSDQMHCLCDVKEMLSRHVNYQFYEQHPQLRSPLSIDFFFHSNLMNFSDEEFGKRVSVLGHEKEPMSCIPGIYYRSAICFIFVC